MPALRDLSGQRFNKLTVKARAENDGHGVRWICQCDCGAERIVQGGHLTSGHTKSCGCIRPPKKPKPPKRPRIRRPQPTRLNRYDPKFLDQQRQQLLKDKANPLSDYTGERFGKLTVLSRAETRNRSTYWLCRCDCGVEKTIRKDALRTGSQISCGCHKKEQSTKHGLYQHPEYRIWQAMMQRCYNSECKTYRWYGALGVTVYKDWHNSPTKFIKWVEDNLGPRPEGKSLDRIDCFGNYEPGNLRWATQSEQVQNQRRNY